MDRLILPIVAAAALLASAVADRDRTGRALRIALRRLLALLPPFLTMLSLAAVGLVVISPARLSAWVSGDSVLAGAGVAAVVGSVALMPGFIAFPLAVGLIFGELV